MISGAVWEPYKKNTSYNKIFIKLTINIKFITKIIIRILNL